MPRHFIHWASAGHSLFDSALGTLYLVRTYNPLTIYPGYPVALLPPYT